jgi:alkylation response protein AidB-like acyl-CoA dehydrogenase
MEWDETQEFPVQCFKEMGKLGLMGVLVPEQYGGAGLTYFEYKIIIEEVSKVCGSIGLSLAAHNSLCTGHILSFANEEQKKKYLPKLSTAEWIGAWGLNEMYRSERWKRLGDQWNKELDHSWKEL